MSGRGRDRIRAEEQAEAAQFCRRQKAQTERLVARDVAVAAGLQLRLVDDVIVLKSFGRFAVVVAGAQSLDIRLGDLRKFRTELLVDPHLGVFEVAVEHPVDDAEREEILCSGGVFFGDLELGDRTFGHTSDVDGKDAVGVEAVVFQRVRLVLGER